LSAGAVAAILTALGAGGSGIYDSGWSVSEPAIALDDHPTGDPTIGVVINHVLEQSQFPLLQRPAPQVTAQQVTAPQATLPQVTAPQVAAAQVSSRPSPGANANNGWKRTEIKFGDLSGESEATPPVAKLSSPVPVTGEDECGGPAPATNEDECGSPAASDSAQQSAVKQDDPREIHAADQAGNSYESVGESAGVEMRPLGEPIAVGPADAMPDNAVDGDPDAGGPAAAPADTPAQTEVAPNTPANIATPPVSATPAQKAPQTVTVKRIPLTEEAPPAKRLPEESPLVEPLKGPVPPLTRNMQNLRNKVRSVLKMYYAKPENSRDNDPWEMMHGMLAYGLKSQIRIGGPKGDLITAVGWLCYNKPSKGLSLLYVTPEGELRAKQGAGLQGHMGQLLAMLAQCQVSSDYPIKVGTHDFTIRDLIEVEKKTCYEKTELTFKLIGLMHYLDTDEKWVNDQGVEWDIPKLIHEELDQPIRGAACGGTHRLSGLSLAARTRVRRGEPLDGEYARANEFVEKYHNYAFQLQNSDGSLSTEWFRGKGDDDDIDRRVKTTGHILEWLCYSLSDDQMRSNRVFAAANYLATLLYTNYDHEWEKGPIGHAIHALRLYDERMLQPYDHADNIASQKPARTSQMAPRQSPQKR
jgi:hypothetical protein